MERLFCQRQKKNKGPALNVILEHSRKRILQKGMENCRQLQFPIPFDCIENLRLLEPYIQKYFLCNAYFCRIVHAWVIVIFAIRPFLPSLVWR